MKKGQRLLHPGYARALRLIVNGGATWRTLAADGAGMNRMSAQRLMRSFHATGLTHIVGWQVESDARARAPIYAIGTGPDVPWPGGERRSRRVKIPIELLTFINAVKALQEDHLNGLQLSEQSGYSPRTARDVIRSLRKNKLVHIAGHQDRLRAGPGYPLYTWAPGRPDKPKPVPPSAREHWTKYNRMRSARRMQAAQMRAIVLAAPMDRRTSAAGLAVA